MLITLSVFRFSLIHFCLLYGFGFISNANGDNHPLSLHPQPNAAIKNRELTHNLSELNRVVSLSAPLVSRKQVDFNLNVKHAVGGISTFQREKFVTIHASHTENDWYTVGENKESDLVTQFVNDYDVYFGRDTGSMAYQLSQIAEDPGRPGFADPAAASQVGRDIRRDYAINNDSRYITQRSIEDRNLNMVVAAQQHPYWPDGSFTGQGWAFSQSDTQSQPFGSATGEFMGQYLAQYFKKNDGQRTSGQPKPYYVEVMNEPLYDLVDAATNPVDLDVIFNFHSTVADQIRNTEIGRTTPNATLKVGGYAAAFPDFDSDNFNEWELRDKRFIDIAGANMDFIAIHLYDFPKFQNTQQYRRGSNMEATFDLLEHYTALTLDGPKPLLISEYGAQVHTMLNDPWTPQRDGFYLDSINAMLMSFMQRPDLIEMTIPFIVVKAEWGRNNNGSPYPYRLMRQQKEKDGESGELWVYTELVKFYQLWSNVNGNRAESHSSEIDLLVDSYVDGNTAYLIVNNLNFSSEQFEVNLHGVDNLNITSVETRTLFNDSGVPKLDVTTSRRLARRITLPAHGTSIIAVSFNRSVTMDATASETKYFATSYKHEIAAITATSFRIENVSPTSDGQAILRLGIGREHGKELFPDVSFNGISLAVNPDYRGDDQYLDGDGRPQFFGLLEILVPLSQIASNNTIDITFPDSGGFISSVVLQQLSSDTELKRTIH